MLIGATASAILLAQGDPARQRAMFVTVLNQQDAPVAGLALDDFRVREDGVQREVLRVEKATGPIEITVMLDSSAASNRAIPDMRRAVTAFVKQVGTGNDIALTTFGGPPKVLQGYTRNRELLNRGIGRLFAESDSGSYLLEALLSVAGGVKKRAPERAEVVALLMRSGPEFSEMSHDRVVQALDDSGTRFDAIVVEGRGSATATTADDQQLAIRERDLTLDEGSRSTGGRNDLAITSLALDSMLAAIGTELLNQYRLVYARPESLIPPTRIEVSVKKPGLKARGTPVRGQH